MRLGIEAGTLTLDIAVNEGILGVPVFADALLRDGIKAHLSPIRERGLEVCQIGAFGFNPLSIDFVNQKNQKEQLERIIPLAVEEIGCPFIVICGGNFHPSGFLFGDPRNNSDDALDRIALELDPFIKLAEKYGAILSVEPYIKTAINTPERFLALNRKVGSDSLRINIDVTSFYGYWEMLDPSSTVQHVCKTLAGHYGLGHIKDLSLTEGFHIHINLAPLGSSSTDWSEVLRLMDPNLPKDSWLILEHVASVDEAHESLMFLRNAADKAGVELN